MALRPLAASAHTQAPGLGPGKCTFPPSFPDSVSQEATEGRAQLAAPRRQPGTSTSEVMGSDSVSSQCFLPEFPPPPACTMAPP